MKRQRHLFNRLLYSYNKYRRKLVNLRLANRNQRRQGILEKHIERLFKKLTQLQVSVKRVAAIATVTGAMAFTPQAGQAQTFSFPGDKFPNMDLGSRTNTTYVDIDNDGDQDIMSGEQDGDFNFMENTGTASAPVYAASQVNPFGLTAIPDFRSTLTFADLDNDGDLDMLSGENYGKFYYYQDTSIVGAPAFDAPVMNPFGLVDIGDDSKPVFVDMDNDGDMDIISGEYDGDFFYFQDTSTVGLPAFDAPVTNPFGLTDVGERCVASFVDIDNDGDLDLIAGEYDGDFHYFQDTSTVGGPAFDAVMVNPFGLTQTEYRYNGNQAYTTTPTFADVDNDGDMDLLTGDWYGQFHFFLNTGTAMAATYVGKDKTNPFGIARTSSYYSAPALVDIDNDGWGSGHN